MKKSTLSAGFLTAMMLFSPITGEFVEASTQTTQQSTEKIMWEKNELSQTQIGRIVFLTDVKLYKRGADGQVSFHLNAKKGSMWRVHKITKEGNGYVYDLGGGVRVKQSNLSTYERLPADIAKKMVEQYGAKITWIKKEMAFTRFSYPQVSRLASEDVENKINEIIEKNAINNASSYNPVIVVSHDLKVVENANNRLKVTQTVEYHDDEGNISYGEVTFIFDLTTGEVDFGDWKNWK